jgi:actin-related protein
MKISKTNLTKIAKCDKDTGALVSNYDGPPLRIETDEEYTSIALALRKVKAQSKEIKGIKDGITKPIQEALANVRELFKNAERRLSDAETYCKAALSDYIEAVEEESQEMLDDAVANSDTKAMAEAAAWEVPKIDGISIRHSEEIHITDHKKIPAEFMSLDMKKIKAAAKAGIEIPGVEVVSVPSLAVRAE